MKPNTNVDKFKQVKVDHKYHRVRVRVNYDRRYCVKSATCKLEMATSDTKVD